MFDYQDEGQFLDSLDAHGLPEHYKKVCGKDAPAMYMKVTPAEALRDMLLGFPTAATYPATEDFVEAVSKNILSRIRQGLSMEIISEPWADDVDALRGAALSVLDAIEKKNLRRSKCIIPGGHDPDNHGISVSLKS
ncbi:hypothetical protein LZ24_00970 [Desulfobotulus alkaliphilus]|uniref:Uncharacterized protein n=1 Tax=Desulfobotulus alkaliphilus TaxID=622671 RepID=A0A562RYZ7_9BACT|nr:hypothetical protein [Desulfobotulus alkaliphilus]TWI74367.1 hypothetical protein LZ24_00970 [Desulfobotulus alkaliphilus]